jgi:hypothetical protein
LIERSLSIPERRMTLIWYRPRNSWSIRRLPISKLISGAVDA